VPLDWNHPNGRTIQLALIRQLAGKQRPSETDRRGRESEVGAPTKPQHERYRR